MELSDSHERSEQGNIGAGQPGLGAEVADSFEQSRTARRIEMGSNFVEQQYRHATLETCEQAAMGENKRNENCFLLAGRSLLRARAGSAQTGEQITPVYAFTAAAVAVLGAGSGQRRAVIFLDVERRLRLK